MDRSWENAKDAEWGVRVKSASRLSFTLIDMSGKSGRRNGMASLFISRPAFQAVLKPSARSRLKTDENTETHRESIESFLYALQEKLGLPDVDVRVEKGIPANVGFGSKTTTLLTLGKAYALLAGKTPKIELLAKLAKRGGTSGGSVNLIMRGGFIVDGGHLNPEDFEANPNKYLIPSRYAEVERIAPVLIHLRFPPWPILIIRVKGQKVFGITELDWFHRTVPIPFYEAQKTAHLVLMNLSTAVAEQDYPRFCQAVNAITYDTYFKGKQISEQPESVQRLIGEAKASKDIDAFGMSSMGPSCYAFTRRPVSVTKWIEQKIAEDLVEDYWFANAQNHPAIYKLVPINENRD